MRSITEEDLPAWYELGWDAAACALVLHVHEDFVKEKIQEIGDLKKAPIVEDLMSRFAFSGCNFDWETGFGFNNASIRREDVNGFRTFSFALPVIKASNRVASIPSLLPAEAISASLMVFSLLSRYYESRTSASRSQLLVFQSIASTQTCYGHAMDGEYSRKLVAWIRNLPDESLEDITGVMRQAYDRMLPVYKKIFQWEYRVFHDDSGRLILDCPGNACGIGPDEMSYEDHEEEGYGWNCHNLDTVIQQLTLLAGLAALHDRARKEAV